MITSIIVEDERYTLEYIKEIVESTGYINVCGAYQEPLEALKDSKIQLIQVAFLDIDMPMIDGFSFAEILQKNNPSVQIVFITAYSEYAVKAFEINSLDYILKPINTDRFMKMAEKLRKTIDNPSRKSNKLSIKCFGSFDVNIDEKPVKWERTKAEELFAFLLTNHKKKIHKERIIEELWPLYEPAKALAIMQTSIYKIRSIFSSLGGIVEIKYEESKYCLNINECDCDLFYIDKLLDTEFGNENFYNNIEEACTIIKDGFLQQNGYLWSYVKNTELSDRFKKIIKRANIYYFENGDKALAQKINILGTKL